jgi:hypothetical protein
MDGAARTRWPGATTERSLDGCPAEWIESPQRSCIASDEHAAALLIKAETGPTPSTVRRRIKKTLPMQGPLVSNFNVTISNLNGRDHHHLITTI